MITPQAVIDYLRTAGQVAMADAVERLRDEAVRMRLAAEKSVQDYYELKDKYEPRTPSPSCWKNHWAGD
jgi:N-acyl-D-aspartate/D-glutamate deacylase